MSDYSRFFEPGLANISPISVRRSRLTGILPVSCYRIGALLALSDFSLIIGLDALVQTLCRPIATVRFGADHSFALLSALSAVLYCLFMEVQDQYSNATGREVERVFARPFMSWLFAFFTLFGVVFFAKAGPELSRVSVVYLFLAGLVLLPAWRCLALRAVSFSLDKHMFAARERIVFISVAESAVDADVRKNDMRRRGKAMVGQVSVGRLDEIALTQLKGLLASQKVDEIWFSCPLEADTLAEVSRTLKAFPLPVFWLADQAYNKLLTLPVDKVGSIKALRMQGGPLTKPQQLTKRLLDVVSASAGLILLVPLFLLIASMIKIDSRGPVIFSQRRSGFNGRTFRIYKFRSMTTADDGAHIAQATRDDPRITRVGRFLRRSSLDELPQLFNVLKGDMSLVGPRPHALCHDTQYSQSIASYALRYHVKPGITGWAQVKGFRGETKTLAEMERRIDQDIWYIKNWSLWLDIKAIFGTLKQLAGTPNAF